MNIIAKNVQRSNIVVVYDKKNLCETSPQDVFSLYSGENLQGSNFHDAPVMDLKIFTFPRRRLKIVFEKNRMRLEDETKEDPFSSKLGAEAHRIHSNLFQKVNSLAFGFNYDIFYRFDEVIPQREIMKQFLKETALEELNDFGWQFTLRKEKSKKSETYFFKVISPLEIALHVNYHFNQPLPLSQEKLQEFFEKCYNDTDKIIQFLSY